MSNNTITASTELIQNYLQGQVMGAVDTFNALQTSEACSMLFYVSAENSFVVSAESSAISVAGWTTSDLSTTWIGSNLPGGTCGLIASDQYTGPTSETITTGSIGLAMVVATDTGDNLCLCLNNSNTDLGWVDSPAWVTFPYDGLTPLASNTNLSIQNTFLVSTSYGQYIVADINSDTQSESGMVSRFYIDPSFSTGCAWVSVGMEQFNPDGFLSCQGCIPGVGAVPGMYSAGTLAGQAQVVFTPLYNPYGYGPPNATQLQWPSNLVPQAIAPFQNADGTTSLFVVANGTLYGYDENSQINNLAATTLLSGNNPVTNVSWFSNVSDLQADLTNDTVTLWWTSTSGGTSSLYYTSCALSSFQSGTGTFTFPVPLLNGVQCASPYINLANNSNTIFAVANNQLSVLNKSTVTSLWNNGTVMLPAVTGTPAVSFYSYTTHVTVTDANNMPVPNTPVTLAALSPNSFYINNLYTKVPIEPITVTTDQNGIVTIIESVSGLAGTQLILSVSGGNAISVNPMDGPFGTLSSSLSTTSDLQSATISYQAPDTPTKPLVSASANSDTVTAVAQSNVQLATAYQNINTSSSTLGGVYVHRVKISFAGAGSVGLSSIWDDLETDIGDVGQWIVNGVESLASAVVQAADGAWQFVVTIAGQAINFVMQTVEEVVSAAQWLITQIIDVVDDVIDFLKFLFDLGDIETVKNIFTNLWTNYVNLGTQNLVTAQQDFDNAMGQLSASLSQWSAPANSTTVAGSVSGQPTSSTAANYLSYHYQNNASQSSYTYSAPSNPVTSLLDSLSATLQQSEQQFSQLWQNASSLVTNFTSMSIGDILTSIVDLMAHAVIDTVTLVGNLLFDLLIAICDDLINVLNTPITIPVVSTILSDFGVSLPSIIDILGWLAAIPATVLYKIATGNSPFSNSDEATFLQNTSTLPNGGMSSGGSNTSVTAAEPAVSDIIDWPTLSQQTSIDLYMTGIMATTLLKVVYTATSVAAVISEGSDISTFSKITGMVGFACELSEYMASIGCDPYPLQNPYLVDLDDYILLSCIFIKGITWYFEKTESGSAQQTAQISQTLEGILTFMKFGPAIGKCVELGTVDDASGPALDLAIMDEVKDISAYAGKILYMILVDTEPNDGLMIAMGCADLLSSGAAIAQAMYFAGNADTIYQEVNS